MLRLLTRLSVACLVMTANVVGGSACQSAPEKTDAPAVTTSAPLPDLPGEPLSLQRIFADPPLAGSTPRGLKFSPDGRWLGFLQGSDEKSDVLDLWAWRLVGDGAPALAPLVRTSDLLAGEQETLTEEEKMARERKRISSTGIVSYKWCGKSGDHILFPLSGDLYYVSLPRDDTALQTTRLELGELRAMDPQCTRDGAKVAFVSGGDIYVHDVATKTTEQVTTGATETLTHGVSEFVAQEEMWRYTGFWISPDGAQVAYLEVDESPVSVKTRAMIYASETKMVDQRYPGAGEANANVRVLVTSLAKAGKKKPVVVPLPAEILAKKDQGYLPRVGWEGTDVVVQWQNRMQTRLVVLRGPPAGPLKVVRDERDSAWVEIHDDSHFFDDGTLLCATEASGVRQLVRTVAGAPGKSTEITHGDEPLMALAHVDDAKGEVFTIRATNRSLERHLFRSKLDGTGDAVQLTKEQGTHAIEFAPSGDFYVDHYSRFDMPPRVTLHQRDGTQVAVLHESTKDLLAPYARPTHTFHVVKASDGTELNALSIPPVVLRNGKKAPVIVYVYGGPTAQVVADGWGRRYPYFVHLAQRGFGVFMIDNRGSGSRDRKFTRAIKNKMGVIEIEDQFAGAAFLSTLPWVDKDRIGIWGWSYGGYASAHAILAENTPFAAAASVAPVTDWSLYDTHYTERYIGTPEGNVDVYKRGNVLEVAERLERPYLLVHGTADDNVLFEHSLQMMKTLQAKSIPFETMIYPGGAHGIYGQGPQLHVYRTLTRFFERSLEPEPAGNALP